MARPGTEVLIADDAPPAGAILDSGQAFFVGSSGRGPVGEAVLVRGIKNYEAVFGERSDGSLLYDAAYAYFGEGGSKLFVSRALGTGSVTATIALGTAFTVHAKSPGAWANGWKVTVEAPPADSLDDGYVIVVTDDDDVVKERSPVLADNTAAKSWADRNADYVDLTKLTDVDPANGATATLATGANGAAIDETAVRAALASFVYGLGPGQVAAPGLTSQSVLEAVADHVADTHRVGLVDLPDSADPTVLSAAQSALYDYNPTAARFIGAFAPWAQVPIAGGAVVTVPYSAVQAALISKSDEGGNPNRPAAGVNGIAQFVVGLSQTYTDAAREQLNMRGVNIAITKYGQVRTYGYRALATVDDSGWDWFGNSRVVMAIAHESDAVAENYVLQQIDGRRKLFARLQSDLRGVCLRYYQLDALYGETPEDAFSVDTGTTVNTIETIAAGEIHAVIRLKASPAGEWVQLTIVKVPVERAL